MHKRLTYSILTLIAFLNFGASSYVHAQPQDLVYTALPPMGQSIPLRHGFGYSTALNSNFAVITNPESLDSNFFYIYKRQTNGVWNLHQTIRPKNLGTLSRLGWTCAMNDSFIAISAVGDTSSKNGNERITGSVLIYKLSVADQWTFHQKITPFDGETEDEFGFQLDISDHNLLISSHSSTDENQSNWISGTGAVYHYQLQNNKWVFNQKICLPRRNMASVDWGLSVHNDLLAIGAADFYDENFQNFIAGAGAVYIYKFESNQWVFNQKLCAHDRNTGESFGGNIDLKGRDLVVRSQSSTDQNSNGYVFSSGAIYYYSMENGSFEYQQKLAAPIRSYDGDYGYSTLIYKNMLFCNSGWLPHTTTGANYKRSGYYCYTLNSNNKWQLSKEYWNPDGDTNSFYFGEVSFNGTTLLLTNRRSYEVHFYEVPYLPPFIGNDTTICSDNSLIIHSQYNADSFPHLWSDGSRDSFILISDSGKYELEVDFNGTKLRDSIHIWHHPQAQVYVGPDTAFCGLFEYTIKAKGEDLHSYQWSNGDSLEYTVAFQAGMYHVRVQDSLNCPGGDTMQLEALEPPEIQLIPDTFTCNNASLTIAVEQNQDYQYLWSTGSQSHSTIITDTGWYSLSVSRPFCEEIDSIYVYEFCPPKPQYWIPNAFSPDLNNLNEKFRPTTVNINSYTISIFNRWGECIYSGNEGWNGIYEGKLCQAGVYVYMIEINAEGMKRYEHGTFTLMR
ncbi:T9SS type B sorting domain-containing protein [bacterium]|nr:T9SS type B sorting domain-containing protein [bacterium]